MILQPRLFCNHLPEILTTPQNNPVQTDPRSLGLALPPQRDRLLSLSFENQVWSTSFSIPSKHFGIKRNQTITCDFRKWSICFQVIISDHNNPERVSIGLLHLADGLMVKSEEFVTNHTVAWVLWVEVPRTTDPKLLPLQHTGSVLSWNKLINVGTLCMRGGGEGGLSDSPKSASTHCHRI